MSEESIRMLIEALCKLNEMPKLHDEETSLLDTQPSISAEALKRSYTNLGNLNDYSTISVLQKNNDLGFVVGIFDGGSFKYFLDIKTRDNPYPVKPTNLSEPYFQISYVSINDLFAEQGYTRSAYKFLVSKYDLVSDYEQYLGGQRLWKSLSKESDVFIYVFDGNKGDYIRNEHNVPIRYMNDSVEASRIWGSSVEYSKILLVASKNEMK